MKTLQLRTADDLRDLLKEGVSRSWVISEDRLSDIRSVEIYSFDGKQVLKGGFNKINSHRDSDGRLVIAFDNGMIVNSNMNWDSRNPVRYV